MGYLKLSCGSCRHWDKIPAQDPTDVTARGMCRESLRCGLAPQQVAGGTAFTPLPYYPVVPHNHMACSHHATALAGAGG
jgi:hypothetical protein